MSEYISREKAINALGEQPLNWDDSEVSIAERAMWEEHKTSIEKIPSENVTERVFQNDPFEILFFVFKKMYPDIKVDGIYWEPNIRDTLNGEKPYGLTDFADDGSVLIFINPDLSVINAIEILAHELAHVAVGVSHDHDKEWENVFDKIYIEYTNFVKSENVSKENYNCGADMRDEQKYIS